MGSCALYLVHVRKHAVRIVAPTLLLGLAACSGGLSAPEDEACNWVHAWATGGRDPESFDGVVAAAREELRESDRESLVAVADDLASASEADRAAKAEIFVVMCRDFGWEPPEG